MGWNQKATSGGGNFEPCPAGNHPAVLVGLIDIGTQKETFQGVTKDAHRIFLCWEVPGEKTSSGASHVIGREYTFSGHEKSGLRIMMEAWRGKAYGEGEEFDPSKLIGKPCLLNVINEQSGDKTYAKIKGVGALPKGMPKVTATLAPVVFNLEDDDVADFPTAEWLPWSYGEQLITKAQRSPEWQAKSGKKPNSTPAPTPTSTPMPVEEEEPVPF